ncbi:agglutinin-like [Rutidosis leptorrhynchoides]|uniref:agglutinin-like n=1 Tax=Rutidosis leptorrhynchoides TaxID=125765 RepID=UPI003A98EDBC
MGRREYIIIEKWGMYANCKEKQDLRIQCSKRFIFNVTNTCSLKRRESESAHQFLCKNINQVYRITYKATRSNIFVRTNSLDYLTMDKSVQVGPWGGNGGNQWDDGVHNGVREISILYSTSIYAIQITYDNNGQPFQAENHAGICRHTKFAQIKLQFPDEILISVSGRYCPAVYGGRPVIRSLTFKSNKRTFGPFGFEEGTPFDFLANGQKIVGFYGKTGDIKMSIANNRYEDKSVQAGPWGGIGGNQWDDGVHNGVREISLLYGTSIYDIQLTYDNNGQPFQAENHAGIGRTHTKSAQIKLQYPDEILVGVSGRYCPAVYGGRPVIRSLTFKSNKRTFGPFGFEEGTPFNFLTNGQKIAGFYGKTGWFLDSIGVHLLPSKPAIFQMNTLKFTGFYHHANKYVEQQKTKKGTKLYLWAK